MEEHISIKYCKRCHRQLKTQKAKELGYGKTCYNKISKETKQYLFDIDKGGMN